MDLKTEEEIRKIYFDAFDNVEITVKEQLKAETEFKELVDYYLSVRGRLAQVKDKKEKKEAKRVAELAKAAANIEKIERNRLEELLNKYGVPDSWKNK